MNLRKHSFLPILVPLLVLALLVPAAAQALERTVSASAEASLEVRNDAALTGFLVAVERRSRAAALGDASRRLGRVLAAVSQVPGVGAGDIATGRVSVETLRHKGATTYRASERVRVVLHRPKVAGILIEAALAAGATGVNGPVYFVFEPERAFAKVLAEAFDRAKARAATLAAQAGATLGPVVAIDEGEGPVLLREGEAGKAFSEPSPPVRPGSSTVTANVRVVFSLQ